MNVRFLSNKDQMEAFNMLNNYILTPFFPALLLHSGIFAQNFIQIYTNPHMGMFGVFKEAERIKELEFVVKLRCFSAKIE